MAEVPGFVEDPLRKVVDLAHRKIVHPLLTSGTAQNDREIAHERALELMEAAQGNLLKMALMSRFFTMDDPILRARLGNMWAPNPLGIAAGFDKNARIHRLLGEGLGFGIVTVGSITTRPFQGNSRPRIFDLPENDELINRMGFPGEGLDNAYAKLIMRSPQNQKGYLLLANIAASKPSFEAGTQIDDYIRAYAQILPVVDGVEINISSPNTEGVRALQEPGEFEDLASKIAAERKFSPWQSKLLIYKFSPDLSPRHLEKVLRIAKDHGADGVTLTNTSTDPTLRHSLMADPHKDEPGGMSGAFLGHRALQATHRAYKYIGDEMFIIRAGGVRGTTKDLWEALTFGGATSAEVYSSFVRPNTSTPNFTVYALRDFARAMRAYGMTSMEDFKALRGKRVPFPRI